LTGKYFIDAIKKAGRENDFIALGLVVMNNRVDLYSEDLLNPYISDDFGKKSKMTLKSEIINIIASFTLMDINELRDNGFLAEYFSYATDYEKQLAYIYCGTEYIIDSNTYYKQVSPSEKPYLTELYNYVDILSINFDSPINLLAKYNSNIEKASEPILNDSYVLSINTIPPSASSINPLDEPRLFNSVNDLVKYACEDLYITVPEYAQFLIQFDYKYEDTDLYYVYTGTNTSNQRAYKLTGTLSVYDRETGQLLDDADVVFDDFPQNDTDTPRPGRPYFVVSNPKNHYYETTKPYAIWLADIINAHLNK